MTRGTNEQSLLWTRRLSLTLAMGVVSVCANLGRADGIPLKLDRGAVTAGEWVPLGVGVPLKEGMVKDPRQVGIVSRSRGALAVQCEAATRYPDGSVQWLWADFFGPAEESFKLVVNAAPAQATTGARWGKMGVRSQCKMGQDGGQVSTSDILAWYFSFDDLRSRAMRVTLDSKDGGRVALDAGASREHVLECLMLRPDPIRHHSPFASDE
jgi:hypothetical protein